MLRGEECRGIRLTISSTELSGDGESIKTLGSSGRSTGGSLDLGFDLHAAALVLLLRQDSRFKTDGHWRIRRGFDAGGGNLRCQTLRLAGRA